MSCASWGYAKMLNIRLWSKTPGELLVRNTLFSSSRDSFYRKPFLSYRHIHYLLQCKHSNTKKMVVQSRGTMKMCSLCSILWVPKCYIIDACRYVWYTELTRMEMCQITLLVTYISKFKLKDRNYFLFGH